MKKNGLSFDTALRQAQEMGYAEADPAADIEGQARQVFENMKTVLDELGLTLADRL